MKLRKWFAARGYEFIRKRAAKLLNRYGITPAKAKQRIEACMATLAEHGCAPTFPTPGGVVQRHPRFLRHLQDAGAEIAVHSYDHVDLKVYPPVEATDQLVRAAQTFERCGIEVHGFRCPYLSCTDELLDVLPEGLFEYSSNEAIWWNVIPATTPAVGGAVFDGIHRLYQPREALSAVCVPSMRAKVLEIPVCVPDDLQLHDGLYLGAEGVARAWGQILSQTHKRGELFTLLFHPELAAACDHSFAEVLHMARSLRPSVWIARLRDISDWWREKSSFTVDVAPVPSGLYISFTCSERATILARGLGMVGSEWVRTPEAHSEVTSVGRREAHPRPVEALGEARPEDPLEAVKGLWDGIYCELKTKALHVPAEPRPFVGLAANAPLGVVSFLREQGYILDVGETATRCGTYIDAAALAGLTSEVKLINYVEGATSPLVRYWRWPGGAKSAMCATGDLDALTLLDYVSRLLVR